MVEGGEWGPLPVKANAKEASLAGRAGIQLISETRQEREKALLSDEACVRAGGGSNISMHHCHSFAGCPHILSSASDMRGIRCRHVTSTLHTPKAHKGLEGILSGCESEKMGSAGTYLI